MTVPPEPCEHLAAVSRIPPRPPHFCEDCLADSTAGVALWFCLTCGKAGCAGGSGGNHAAEHYAETDHPVAQSLGDGPRPRWCYPDQRIV